MPYGQRAEYIMTPRIKLFFQIVAGIIGFIIGVACYVTSLLNAGGMGHGSGIGLTYPVWFSLLSIVLTPLALIRLASYRTIPVKGSVKLLTFAIALDLFIVLLTWVEWNIRIKIGFLDVIIWIAFWSVWQLAALLTLIFSLLVEKRGKSNLP
jgi:hypothetical protein